MRLSAEIHPSLWRLNQIARELAISHQHLSDTLQQETGHHPCHFYDEKIIERAKALLKETNLPVAQIALQLTYDPSNFSKFFKNGPDKRPELLEKIIRNNENIEI